MAAVVVPVGFALSLDSRSRGPIVATHAREPVAHVVTPTPFVATTVATTTAALTAIPQLPDGAKLFVVGFMLCGLAAAVRRAS